MKLKLLFGVSSLLFMCGCWDRDEIEDRSTILGLAIDIADEQEDSSPNHPKNEEAPTSNLGMIKVTAQVAIPGKVPLSPGGGGESKASDTVWVVETIGHTMGDAMQNLQQKLAHQIFLGHLKIIMISKEVAERGVSHINEYLRRVPDVRRTAWVAVNGDDAAHTMETAPKMESVPTKYLITVFNEAVKMGKFPEHNLGLFWIALSDRGREAFLPYITVEENEHIKIEGLAYFKGDKMVGRTEPYQIAYFNGLTEHNPGGSAALMKLKNGEGILFSSIKRKTKYEIKMRNGKPTINVVARIEGEIREKTSEEIQLDNPEIIADIEQQFNKVLKKEFTKLIEETQEVGSDIFGFGEYVRGYHPDYWSKHIKTEENWQEVYKDLKISVEATSKIRRSGMRAQ